MKNTFTYQVIPVMKNNLFSNKNHLKQSTRERTSNKKPTDLHINMKQENL